MTKTPRSTPTTRQIGRHEGPFYFVASSPLDRYKKRSDGTWTCSGCHRPATQHHDRPPCHRCEDWFGCGKDCTLSAISCERCKVRREVS